jgi:hypothetical protein
MFDAKNTMLHFMAQSGVWPVAHTEALAAFFVALGLHPGGNMSMGKKPLYCTKASPDSSGLSTLNFNIEAHQ